jgi:hypothetical protein
MSHKQRHRTLASVESPDGMFRLLRARSSVKQSDPLRAIARIRCSQSPTSPRSPHAAASPRERCGDGLVACAPGRDPEEARRTPSERRRPGAKHFELDIGEHHFAFARKHEAIAAEAALDGIYIIRTSVDTARMEAADCVRNYKALANVERAFRSLKTVDLKVRPIHHRAADRVRAHILLCMLAYYVEWHMREAWRELMFADTDQAAKATRDSVAPAQRSQHAQHKVASHTVEDGTPAHSFSTLMAELGGIVRNTCRTSRAGPEAPTFDIVTTPNATQRHALDLIRQIRP